MGDLRQAIQIFDHGFAIGWLGLITVVIHAPLCGATYCRQLCFAHSGDASSCSLSLVPTRL
jgi:hypothetical protein